MKAEVELGNGTTSLVVSAGSRRQIVEQAQSLYDKLIIVSENKVLARLDTAWFPACPVLSFPAGEASKSLQVASKLWSQLFELGADRNTAILAVGGGVVTDLVGFVAATFMRGLPLFSVPTSLLAMVDASVGGKVGIDLAEGKNLVGCFYPAAAVAVDPELLSSLEARDWADGMSEVFKHGILSGPDFWSRVKSFTPEHANDISGVESLVRAAVEVKLRVVKEDPFERLGLRATLNLGHTFAHAIEWVSEFQVSHGQAVGLGLLAGLRLSRLLGLLRVDFEEDLLNSLKAWSLPTTLPEGDWDWEKMELAFSRDKKNRHGQWNFILPREIGLVESVRGPEPELVKEAFGSLMRGVV